MRVLVLIALLCAFLAPMGAAPAKHRAKRATKRLLVKTKAKVKTSAKVKARGKVKRQPQRVRARRVLMRRVPPVTPSATCQTCSGNLLEVANAFTGLPYRRGGSTPETGFDCSGFVKYVYQTAQELLLPRSASQQFTQGVAVNKEDLVAGDLVFFRRGRSHWHVGIYNGDGQFIHSPNSRQSIKLTSLDTPYYKRYYIGARRVVHHTLMPEADLQIPDLPPPAEYTEAGGEDQR